jgi:hypothetical protein
VDLHVYFVDALESGNCLGAPGSGALMAVKPQSIPQRRKVHGPVLESAVS